MDYANVGNSVSLPVVLSMVFMFQCAIHFLHRKIQRTLSLLLCVLSIMNISSGGKLGVDTSCQLRGGGLAFFPLAPRMYVLIEKFKQSKFKLTAKL
jgi:hypothetical protein